MSVYKIPPDVKEKEKIIGGTLNINQFGWLLTALILAAGVFALTVSTIGILLSSIFSFFAVLMGVPFAFYKKQGLTLYAYLYYLRKHKRKKHYLPNIRTERMYKRINAAKLEEEK